MHPDVYSYKTCVFFIDLAEMHNAQPEFLDKFWSEFQDLWATLYNTKLATISAINGITFNYSLRIKM